MSNYRHKRKQGLSSGPQPIRNKKLPGTEGLLVKTFLKLPSDKLEKLFNIYEQNFGERAAIYARQTYPKWQADRVRTSSLTVGRLVSILPMVLTFKERCNLLRQLRLQYRMKDQVSVALSVDELEEKLPQIALRVVEKAYKASLPTHISQRLAWLSMDDVGTANALLAEVEAQEGRATIVHLTAEIKHIRLLLEELPYGSSIEHVIKLPHGIINVSTERKPRMSNQNKTPIPTERSLYKDRPSDLIENALSHLDDKQIKDFSVMAANEAIKLSVEKERAKQRFSNAKVDMGEFIGSVKELDKGNRDYDIHGNFQGASGVTSVRVSRQRNQTAVIVSVVIGIILILYFLSRN